MRPQFPAALLLILAVASPSIAQEDHKISLFADADRDYCAIAATPGIHSVHIFHTGASFATASRFSVPTPECWHNATWVADHINPAYLSLGNSQTDLSVAYSSPAIGCTPTPIYVGSVDFLVSGVTPSCCEFEAQPAASLASIMAVDCFYQELDGSAGNTVIVNPERACPCDIVPPPPPPPTIALFADAEMAGCELTDLSPPGVRSVHMFHLGSLPATASQFAAPKPACWTGATWLGDQIEPPFLVLGTSQDDISIAYTHCLDPPIYLGRINYLGTGMDVECCVYPVVPASGYTDIVSVDCDYQTVLTEPGASVTINPTPECPCDDAPVSVEETTWGRIKAMYSK